MIVKPKKHLGQHFLNDKTVSQRLALALEDSGFSFDKVLEVGPGMGALTDFLLKSTNFQTHVIEIDRESVQYLKENYPQLEGRIYEKDFLNVDLKTIVGDQPIAIAGNFPYNISTEILFTVLDYKDQIPVVVGMFQKEVAERIAEPPGSKKYGITSVLLQAFYDIEYLFTVLPEVFTPPPKVDSGVIRLKRNATKKLDCNEAHFKKVVKMAFNQRRKTLRNSLKAMINENNFPFHEHEELFSKRPERLSVEDFVHLTQLFEAHSVIK
ncbi:MAG: 16S rRNA (adenine(1518)-N(6)/adenine(1519)-N(6))-dimethyltransferase RsmA [Crocinitomix sp.]|nr:16S rRNA (adenine(1518)-N(6)/adenine(1519)-N(6))-dimethyltransferase RsmA [Crocinitomix sp.]